jgi:microcin C transport system substrate-binding protein
MYDFESQKDTIFYGQYERIDSYFSGTELASSGLPEGRELEILEEVRDLVPPEVFTEPYTNPVNGTPDNVRANAREAVRLFREAGYEIRNGKMVNAATGEPFTIEMIDDSPSTERVVLPYAQSLQRIGVEMRLRIVDSTQMLERLRNRDFEMTIAGWAQSLSPGNEQRDYWGSAAADQPNSQNHAGIKDPGVDALIDKVILAKDRDELIAATKALDRVLLAHDFVIPQFTTDKIRTVRWNRFSHPDNIPPYTHGFPTLWWWDAEKAASIGSRS